MERPYCLMCGSPGNVLYGAIEDPIYRTAGHWRIRRCSSLGCGLAWIDPLPREEELAHAYAEYYTHESAAPARRWRALALSLVARTWRLTPMSASEDQQRHMFLNGHPAGRLLDVGCGAGAFLNRMRNRGWSVEGLDTDPLAARRAREDHGLSVTTDSIEKADYAPESFDAVTLSHVIEHVRDPVELLSECWRVLRPSGQISVTTPNVCSLAHKLFGPFWRGLEPPRHLQAGLENIEIRSSAAKAVGFFLSSIAIRRNRKRSRLTDWFPAILFTVREHRLLSQEPYVGEELVLLAHKSHDPVHSTGRPARYIVEGRTLARP
jgi:2-polyprenyl-3-methyl-5-hydroxy-6-metoxy-1,4-benzoquinol methylase